ncbi:regulator of chromosome condensation 1/beta-lactamase-inhibitor protein II [Dactylonectria estremocensis]|uniref:Regulator of chromosome condensation 1/beta-lactamase-inhibitor protein II n=1 Tax=Dactylonectria estremocensis TaxID=1079267 RepID=A0A9P9J9H2_9HYPO|nr:regulator of chromosome condensation 1/beta-lactamase-inhibitor protein II [Dactylonectria estremocensis]
MAPRAKAAAPKATTTKKAAASATAGVKKAAKPVAKPAAKTADKKKAEPAANGASKKRKADDTESEAEAPKAKKTKTAREIKPVKKPATKATKAKTAAPKTTKAEEAAKKSKVEEPKKPKAEKPKAKPKAEEPVKKPKATTPKPEADETEEEGATPEPETKTKPAKKAAAPAAKKPEPKPKKIVGIGRKINDAPTQILDVYVFGEGSSGELGLGSKRVNGKKPIDVKRPRLNDNLSAAKVGVVQVSCGGMHAVALTHDNKILTWGVNDQGALGRDTNWDGGLRDMDKGEDSDSDEDEDDSGVNPLESTPTAVSNDHFAPGTKFVQVIACDSASFALTEDGRVYGWGTFRSSDGILGFSETVKIQSTPALLPALKNIKSLAAGSNHVLALDHKGNVLAWGCGQQNQLARRIIERNKMSSLVPQGVGLPRGKIVKIACGSYHSFAIDKNGHVWGWGLNNFGEIGVEANAGEDDAVILRPAKITYLEDYNITDIDGGEHHSLACSKDGKLITWGRVDGYQVGFEFDKLTEDNAIYDERGNARILFKPTVQPDVTKTVAVAAGTDNNFAITSEGKVYSWGFSANYQTGQGTLDDITTPTLIDNTAIRGKNIVAAGAGGQYSVLIGTAEDAPKTNGATTNGTHADDDKENTASKTS